MGNPNAMYDEIYKERQRLLETGDVPILSALASFGQSFQDNLAETPRYLNLAQNKVNHVLGIKSNQEVADRAKQIDAYYEGIKSDRNKRATAAYKKNSPMAYGFGQIAGMNKGATLGNILNEYGTEPYLDREVEK